MRLEWKEDGKSRIIAEYEAYSTPDGPAIATAIVSAQYGDWRFCDYETRVVDPYLKACGAGVYFTVVVLVGCPDFSGVSRKSGRKTVISLERRASKSS